MTHKPFLALITPIGESGGGQPNPPPLGIWGGGNQPFPTPPIAMPPGGWGSGGGGGGQPPLGIWGGGGIGNYPDAGFPGPQPGQPPRPWGPINYPDQGLPGNQPGIWPGPKPPYIDAGFPGPQPGGPVYPSHPIYYPPVIWDPSRPSNPIVNPGDPNNPAAGQPEGPKVEWKTAWSPTTGWVVVGVPTGEHVTPSAEEPPKP